MSTEQCTGHVFSPHTFVHTNERVKQELKLQLLGAQQSAADEDSAAAALCALPTTVEGMKKLDARTFQHIWAQIKECSDRLCDLTSVATAAAAMETKAIAASTPALFPLLQQLLGLFHTFNSSVSQQNSQRASPSPVSVTVNSQNKRKLDQLDQDAPSPAQPALMPIKREQCEDKADLPQEDNNSDSCQPSSAKRQKRTRRARSKPTLADLRCHHCGETDTPEWRKGPAGPKTLCNACGLQYAKYLREADKREKCRLPLSLVLNS